MAATSSDVVVDDAGNVCLDIMVRQLSLGDEPPALLLSLPADMLLHIVSLLDVVGLLKFEAAAKSAAQIGGCAEWERRLRQMLTNEALAACAAGVGNVDTTLPITGDGARRTLCTMLRVPFVMWGNRFLPESAKKAQDAFEGAGGVVECEACWPVAIRPEHLERWWSAQALAPLLIVLTELEVEEKLHELTSPAHVAEVAPGPPHESVRICLGALGEDEIEWSEDENFLAEVGLLELCDSMRYYARYGGALSKCCAADGAKRLVDKVADLLAWRTCGGPDSESVADLKIGLLHDGRMLTTPGDVNLEPFLSPPYGFSGPRTLAEAVVSNVLFGGAPGGYVNGWHAWNDLEGTHDVEWGGRAWESGREWWGNYCWVACRVLAPGERASEWAGEGPSERRLAMLKLTASTTD